MSKTKLETQLNVKQPLSFFTVHFSFNNISSSLAQTITLTAPKRHKDDKFTTFVGLARGYTAIGNNKEAIKNWETALKNIPDDQKPNAAIFERT